MRWPGALLLLLLPGASLSAQQPDSTLPGRAVPAVLAPAPADSAPPRDSLARGDASARPGTVARIDTSAAARRRAARRAGYIYLHPDRDYGSDVIRSPVDVFLNRGMSVLVFENQERALGRIHWGSGWASVRDAVTHPHRAIMRSGGVKAWLECQFLPNDGRVWEWAWAPNYSGHIVAGGITHRFLTEWFDERGVPAPWLAAFVLNAANSVTNEMIENQRGPPGEAATVADLLIFDQLSVLVFSFDYPARFFAEKLKAADWSPQATIALPGARVLNSSQVLSYKLPVPRVDRLGVLFLIGQAAQTGLRLRLDESLHVSGAVGFETTSRVVDVDSGLESVHVDWGGGFYVDRNNSLLASVVLSPRAYTGLTVNVFPGVLPGELRPAGVWAAHSRRAGWSMGLAFQRTLGLGLGVGFPH